MNLLNFHMHKAKEETEILMHILLYQIAIYFKWRYPSKMRHN